MGRRAAALQQFGEFRELAILEGRDNGLVLRVIGERIAFAPPLVISEAEIEDMVTRLGHTLDKSHRELSG